MANTVGLVNLDPIQGLINYATDIKPYHTKIFETLVEYVYTDNINVTVLDSMISNVNYNPVDVPDVSVTEFVETLAFGWDSNFSYTIVGMTSQNQLLIAGNISTVTKPYDFTTISAGSPDNGEYQVISSVYDPILQQTVVTLNPTPSGTLSGGTFTVQDIDVPYWYQFSVISLNPVFAEETVYEAPITPVPLSSFSWSSSDGIPPNILSTQYYAANAVTQKIILDGNATTAIQVGAEFELIGTSVDINGITCDSTIITSDNTHITCDNAGTIFSSDGIYHALTVRYDPIQNITTIGVGPGELLPSPFTKVLGTAGGGFAQPYRYIGEGSGTYDLSYDTYQYDIDKQQIIPGTLTGPAPCDPLFNNVVLLLTCDGTNGSTVFADSSLVHNIMSANGGAQISTANPVFGTGALLLDGTNATVTCPITPGSPLDLSGGQDFTVEGWVYIQPPYVNEVFFEMGNYLGGNGFYIAEVVNPSPPPSLAIWTTTGVVELATPEAIDINGWAHFALVRHNNTLTFYGDGIGATPLDLTGLTLVPFSGTCSIGGGNGTFYAGQMDEIRITNGIARYTSNFTPPTSPFELQSC